MESIIEVQALENSSEASNKSSGFDPNASINQRDIENGTGLRQGIEEPLSAPLDPATPGTAVKSSLKP